jgi:hypothetical protein
MKLGGNYSRLPSITEKKASFFMFYFFPWSPACPDSYFSPCLLCLPHIVLPTLIHPLRWRSSATSKLMKWKEWRMEVLSLPESALIRPLNPPHHSFLLRLDVFHLCCRTPAFHYLPMAADEGDEGRLSASTRFVKVPSD